MITLTFAAGLMAAAAVVAAIVAGAGGGPAAQALTFAATSLAALFVVRPLLSGLRVPQGSYRSGVAALIDRPAIVVTQVDASSGTVRIGGEVWSARAYDQTQVMAEGTWVAVFDIEGATALVYPREP
jgi:membrane protein implicated in regulation of membrane protease activity